MVSGESQPKPKSSARASHTEVTSSNPNKRRDQNFEKVSDSSTTSVFNGANLHFLRVSYKYSAEKK